MSRPGNPWPDILCSLAHNNQGVELDLTIWVTPRLRLPRMKRKILAQRRSEIERTKDKRLRALTHAYQAGAGALAHTPEQGCQEHGVEAVAVLAANHIVWFHEIAHAAEHMEVS